MTMAAAAAANKTYSLILYYLFFLLKKNKTFLHAPPHLPCDLVEEILCRLPVKQLRQLCCVCKSWNSLISHDSKFAKKHLRFSNFSHDRHHLSLTRSSELFRIWNFPISSFFSSEAASTDSFTPLGLSHKHGRNCYEEVSTIDGIFCFKVDESIALLFNPSIRKFNYLLPPLKNSYYQTTYTLVYDRFIGNYKIIATSEKFNRLLSHFEKNKKDKQEVNVYTLGANDWRKIQDFPYHYYRANVQGIFVSDSVNWLVHDTTCRFKRVIVSLDLENESYQQLLVPNYSDEYYSLWSLRDCLCILSDRCEFCDIWIMKEYGNEKSWTKLLTVPHIGDPLYSIHAKPLYIYEDDRVLMMFVKTSEFILAIYDSKNNTFKTHQIQNDRPPLVVPKVYVESLISPFLQY